MIEIAACRIGVTLVPAAEYDRLALARFAENKPMLVILAMKDADKLRRFYRNLCHYLAKGMGLPNGDAVHSIFMMRAFRIKAAKIGQEGEVLHFESSSTKDWTPPEWLDHVEFCREIVLREMLPGIPTGHWRREVERVSGVNLTDAIEEAAA